MAWTKKNTNSEMATMPITLTNMVDGGTTRLESVDVGRVVADVRNVVQRSSRTRPISQASVLPSGSFLGDAAWEMCLMQHYRRTKGRKRARTEKTEEDTALAQSTRRRLVAPSSSSSAVAASLTDLGACALSNVTLRSTTRSRASRSSKTASANKDRVS